MVQVVSLLSTEASQCDAAHLLQELKVLKFFVVMVILSLTVPNSKYGKDFMSLEFPPSYSNLPMYHRNDRLLTVKIL